MINAKLLKFITLWTTIGFFTFFVQAYAAEQYKPKPENGTGHTIDVPEGTQAIDVPEGTQAVLLVTRDGKIRVTDAQGKEFVPCLLCSTAYVLENPEDPHCDKLRERIAELPKEENEQNYPICGALTRSTVNNIVPINVLQSHTRSDCTFIQSLGTNVATIGSPDHKELEQWLAKNGPVLGFSPQDIEAILAAPLTNCLH